VKCRVAAYVHWNNSGVLAIDSIIGGETVGNAGATREVAAAALAAVASAVVVIIARADAAVGGFWILGAIS